MGWSNSNAWGDSQEGWYKLPAAGYTPQGVHFSSAGPQFLNRGAALTGVTNTKVGAVSFWFRATANDANTFFIFSDNLAFFFLRRNTTGVIQLIISDGISFNPINVATTSTVFTAANGSWHHYLASWNVAASPNVTIYVDGALDTNATPSTATQLDYAGTDWFLPNNGQPMDGDIADFWFDTGIAFASQLDLSVLANRQKFINGGNAVNLGTSGQTPSGTSPPVFFSGTVAAWNTNKGSGGGFTLNSGPLTAASSNPP
jgi:hypothetical protein